METLPVIRWLLSFMTKKKGKVFLAVFLGSISNLAIILILVIGYQQQTDANSVMRATIIALSSFGPVLALNGLGNGLLTTLASGRRLFALMNEQPAVSFEHSQTALNDFKECTVDNLFFSYSPEQEPIVKELTFSFKQGEVIGIGGESGSGKSTINKLFMRYWDPEEGSISFDKNELKDLTEESLHHMEGIMEQSTFIFNDTIFNNIACFQSDKKQEMIEAAAKKACIHEWILSLPEQYETRIGGNNREVSDGERQRIGLARIFAYDAPFILLDEPTSNLDYYNEQKILQTIQTELENKTVLLISHRETTLEIATKRYEMLNGKLVESSLISTSM